MDKRMKVRLKVDLTRYIPNLIVGSEGYTIGRYGDWSRGSDRFVGVVFPNIGTLDVLWESLDIIDEEYLKVASEDEKTFIEELRSAKDVLIVVGPKGGFRYLIFDYKNIEGVEVRKSIGFKKEAERCLKIFEENGILVKRKIAD